MPVNRLTAKFLGPVIFFAFVLILCQPAWAATDPGWSPAQWRDLTISIPPDWRMDRQDPDQAVWSAGDPAGGKFKYFSLFTSPKPPEETPLKPGAVLRKIGPRSLAGQPGTMYEMTFEAGGKRYRLVSRNRPDQDGKYIAVMTGAVGLDFEAAWPDMDRMIASVALRRDQPLSRPADQSPPPTAAPAPAATPAPPVATPTPPSPTPALPVATPAPPGAIPGQAVIPAGWKSVEVQGATFSVPPEWSKKGGSYREKSFGSQPGRNPMGANVMVSWDRKPITAELDKFPLPIKPAGKAELLGGPVVKYEGQFNFYMRFIQFEAPMSDGLRMHALLGVMGPDRKQGLVTLEKILGGLTLIPPAQPGTSPNKTETRADGWTVVKWGQASFALPPGWKKENQTGNETQWNSADKDKGTTLVFGLVKSTLPLPEYVKKQMGGQPGRFKKIGPTTAAGLPAQAYEFDSQIWLRVFGTTEPNSQGQYLGVMLGVIGEDHRPHLETLNKILASIRPTGQPDLTQPPAPPIGQPRIPAPPTVKPSPAPPAPAVRPEAKVVNRAYIFKKKSGRDYVGRNRRLAPNGSPDAWFQVRLAASDRRATGFKIVNRNGQASSWSSVPGPKDWLLAAAQGGKLLSKPDHRLFIDLSQPETVLDLFVQDNNSLAAGHTDYELIVTFEKGQPISIPIEKTPPPENDVRPAEPDKKAPAQDKASQQKAVPDARPAKLSPAEQEELALEIFRKLKDTPNDELETFNRLYREVIDKCPQTERAEVAYWRLSNLLILGYEPPRRKEAIALLEQFLARYPKSQGVDRIKNRLRVQYGETGQPCKEAALYGEIAPKVTDPPDGRGLAVWMLYADALAKCGQKAEAKKWYNKVLAADKDPDSLNVRAAKAALEELN